MKCVSVSLDVRGELAGVNSSSVDRSPLSFALQDDNSDCVQSVFSGHDCLHLHSGPQHPSGLLHRWSLGVRTHI